MHETKPSETNIIEERDKSDIEEIEPDRMIEEWGKRARHIIIEERKRRLNNWGKKKKQNDWGKGR